MGYPRFTALFAILLARWVAGVPDAHFNASSVLVVTVTLTCEVPVAEDAAQLSGRIPRPPPTASQLVVYAAYGRHDLRQVWAVDRRRALRPRPTRRRLPRRAAARLQARGDPLSVLGAVLPLHPGASHELIRSFSTAPVTLRQRMRGT